MEHSTVLIGQTDYTFIQLNNRENFKHIFKVPSTKVTPYFLEENFTCIRTRLAIALPKPWHTMLLLRHVSHNSVILIPYLSSSDYFGISVLLTN